MAVALSSPATFLHELMHITTRSVTDPSDGVTKKAYGPILTGYLAQINGQKTVTNADNYAWFATAMYLNGPLARRSVLLGDGERSWRNFLRGKTGNETIDTDGMDMDGDDGSAFPWDK